MIRNSMLVLLLAAAACAMADEPNPTGDDPSSDDVSTLDDSSIGQSESALSPPRECWYSTSHCTINTCFYSCTALYCDHGVCHELVTDGCYSCPAVVPPHDPPPHGPFEM